MAWHPVQCAVCTVYGYGCMYAYLQPTRYHARYAYGALSSVKSHIARTHAPSETSSQSHLCDTSGPRNPMSTPIFVLTRTP